MKILIVEDDAFKAEDIKSVILKEIRDCRIKVAKSFQSGCEVSLTDKFDLLILDMSIPNFDICSEDQGGETLKNGGELIMRELIDEGRNFNAVILSQYETFAGETIEQIDKRLKEFCQSKYMGWIKYSISNNDWQEKLLNTIKKCYPY